MEKIQSPSLVEWALSTSPKQTKQNFESTNKTQTAFYLRHYPAPTQPLQCSRTWRPLSAGRPPSKLEVASQKSNRRVTTNELPKKTRNVNAPSLSLILFSQSSGDSPQAESSRRSSSAYQRPWRRAHRCKAQFSTTTITTTTNNNNNNNKPTKQQQPTAYYTFRNKPRCILISLYSNTADTPVLKPT